MSPQNGTMLRAFSVVTISGSGTTLLPFTVFHQICRGVDSEVDTHPSGLNVVVGTSRDVWVKKKYNLKQNFFDSKKLLKKELNNLMSDLGSNYNY